RARRAGALVLVEDPGGGVERLLQSARPPKRRGPPDPQGVLDRLRDVDVSLLRDLLFDQFHRKQRRQVLWPDGLLGAWMQCRDRRERQVGLNVVPARGHLLLVEQEPGCRWRAYAHDASSLLGWSIG